MNVEAPLVRRAAVAAPWARRCERSAVAPCSEAVRWARRLLWGVTQVQRRRRLGPQVLVRRAVAA
jgi:hypothetical protein